MEKSNWNELAKGFADINRVTDWLIGFPAVLKEADARPGQTVLDYGCGDGQVCIVLASNGVGVIGVDNSEEMINLAKERNSHKLIRYYKNNDSELDVIPDNSVDVAMANFVFLTIDKRDVIKRICREILRTLKSGGKFIICTNGPNSLNHKYISYSIIADNKCIDGNGYPNKVKLHAPNGNKIEFTDYYWSPSDYEEILTAVGFNVKKSFEPELDLSPEGLEIIDELTYPPFLIVSATKGENKS